MVPDTGRDDLIEVLGEGGHAALLREVGRHRQVQEPLEDAHQPQRDVGPFPLLQTHQQIFTLSGAVV